MINTSYSKVENSKVETNVRNQNNQNHDFLLAFLINTSYFKDETSICNRNNQIHDFHLVDPSPWPIVGAFSALMLTSGAVLTMHAYYPGTFILVLGLILLLLTKMCWWRDIIREATFESQHTYTVQTGLRLGMFLFIVS